MFDSDIISLTDSYKFTHHKQYPEGTTGVYSYLEAREKAQDPCTMFFGLQSIIKRYLIGPVVCRNDIERASAISKVHFGDSTIFNRPMWEHILGSLEGRLPIRIKAVPEGTVVSNSNVLMAIENTDDRCAPLTNHLETLLSHVWAPSTVATRSFYIKKMIEEFLESSSDQKGSLDFQLHDFGCRGVPSPESAYLLGAAHLINFKGTDTLPALNCAITDYNANLEGLAYSVPATEHSVMTSLGKEGELDVIRHLLKQYPVGIVSCVGDSYNINTFVHDYVCRILREDILARNHEIIPCKFVVRPDSLRNSMDTVPAQVLWILDELWDAFGGKENSKGYRVLNPHVGVLWGDGLMARDIHSVLLSMVTEGYSAENIVFGMGGGLLQKIDRDTQRFAIKCSAQKRDGIWHSVRKNPLDTSKTSKEGRLKLLKNYNGEFLTVQETYPGEDQLATVFENGELLRDYSWSEVRDNASQSKFY